MKTCHIKNATKMFDYTAIADYLRTVSLSNDCHSTCVLKPVNGIQTVQLTAKTMQSNEHTFKKL